MRRFLKAGIRQAEKTKSLTEMLGKYQKGFNQARDASAPSRALVPFVV